MFQTHVYSGCSDFMHAYLGNAVIEMTCMCVCEDWFLVELENIVFWFINR